MAAPSLADAFQFGIDILSTVVAEATKKIFAQTGDVNGQGQTDSDNVEWWQHVGFASRPPKAEPGKTAAQACVIRQGNTDVAFASQDLRGLELYGNLAEGETCIYASGTDGAAQGRVLLKKDGSVTVYTRKGNTSGGAGMMIQADAASGAIRLINDQGYGIIIDADGIKLTAGASGLTLNADGSIKLVGTGQTQVDGATVVLGSTVLPAINAALTGVTGIAGKASLKVLIE